MRVTPKSKTKTTNLKTQKNQHTTYFDACTQLLYKDREMQLLNQLCNGNTNFTQQILRKELHYFLHHSDDTKYAKSIASIDELCYYLRVSMKHKGLFERVMAFFSDSTSMIYYTTLQSLNANHYLAVMTRQLRSDNNNPLFQYIFFQFTKDIKTKKQFNSFQQFSKFIYGEEFFLVMCHDELKRLQIKYTKYKHQILFMLRKKGFAFDDTFTSRNPAYYFDSNINRDMLHMLQHKLNSILKNCDVLQKHIRMSSCFATQTKQYRQLMEKRHHEMNMQNAREARLIQHKERNRIEADKVKIKKNRNAIEIIKLLK